MKLDHIAIDVKDPDWYIHFFEECFGETVVKTAGTKVWLKDGIQVNKTEEERSCAGHVAFVVDDYEECLKKIPRDLPVLLISGGMDPVGSFGKGPRQVAARLRTAGMKKVQLNIYPEDRHEVLNELNKEEVNADIFSFLEDCLRLESVANNMGNA